MSKKKLTVYDATKEELIQYLFSPFDGGFRIPEQADRFLLWLRKKRADELLKSYEDATEESNKALKQYIGFVKQANEESDIDKKLELLSKANTAYERYEKMEKIAEKTDKKLEDVWNDGCL